MIKKHFLTWLLIFALAISGCSIEINQPTQPIPLPSLISPTQPNPALTSSLPTLKELVTWSSLKLTGKLVYIAGKTDSINLVTGYTYFKRFLYATSGRHITTHKINFVLGKP